MRKCRFIVALTVGSIVVLLPAGGGTASAEQAAVTPPPGPVLIHPAHVGAAKCLGVDGGGTVGAQVKQFVCGGQNWQRFTFEEVSPGSGKYMIHPGTPSATPLCLGVEGQSTQTGALIRAQVCNGVENQAFTLERPPESGAVETLGRVVHSALYIGVENGNTGDGIPVRQFVYDGSPWKRFTLEPV